MADDQALLDRLAILEEAHADLVTAFFRRISALETRLAQAETRLDDVEKFLGPKAPY